MTLSSDNRYNSPWEYPDCPDCGRHIYVEFAQRTDYEFECHKCGVFDRDDLSASERYEVRI